MVVVNPTARREPAAIVDLLKRRAPAGVRVEVRRSVPATEAGGLTADDVVGSDAVVAVGGDGTVAAVAPAVYATGVPLGIIPAGSTNIVARELRIPTRPDAAVALIYGRHRLRSLDIGRCGERVFLHMAGAGLDSHLFADTDLALKRRLGWLAYVPSAARNLPRPPTRFTIEADGSTLAIESRLVLVANGGSIIAPGFNLYPDIVKDDGWLDVLVFTPIDPLAVALTLGRLATRTLAQSPYVVRLKAHDVRLTTDPPVPVQLDGDVVTQTPATFRVVPAALRVIVPPV